MNYSFNKDNPMLRQHVIHVGRHELLRQHFEYNSIAGQRTPQFAPIWLRRKVISINDNLQEEMQMREILPVDTLYIRCTDDDSMTEEQACQIWHYETQLYPDVS